MTNSPVVQIDYFQPLEGEPLFNPESDHLKWSYVRIPNVGAGSLRSVGGSVVGGRSVRTLLRRGLTGSASTGSRTSSRSAVHARAAIAFIGFFVLASGCSDAVASTKTTKATVKSKTTAKRKTPSRPTTTVKRPTSTVLPTTRPATSLAPNLSAEAQAVLAGYASYLVVFAAAAREPERAGSILPKGVTGDSLARLIDIARFNVAEGQYWDGTRTNIVSTPRVQSIGESRATLRDCQTVGGVLRKRTTNEVVPGSTEPDVDDLIVDLVKIGGRWVVTRTDRTNALEGKGTCAPASSP